MFIIKEQSLELYYPDKKARTQWYQQLSFRNKPDLEDMAAPLRRIMRNKRVTAIDAQGNRRVPTEISNFLNTKQGVKKDTILDFLCFMLADVRNFCCYIDTLNEKDRKVWAVALTQYYINVDEIHLLTGEHWVPKKQSWYYSYFRSTDISDKLFCFSLVEAKGQNRETDRWAKDIYCRLNEMLHASLLPVFFPDACNLEKQFLDELPETMQLHTFSGEADILMFLPTLNGLYETGQLALSKSRISQTALRKLAQTVSLDEFFPNHALKELAFFRRSVVMNLYVLGRQNQHLSSRPEKMLKQIFLNALSYPVTYLPLLLFHLTGLRKGELLNSYAPQLSLSLWDLLGTLPQDKWVPVQGIYFKLMQTANIYVPLFAAYIFDKMDVYNDKLGHSVYLDRLYNELSVPFINSLLYAMSAFGFVEVAYAEVGAGEVSYVSSLAYVRLTNLGAFALGQVQSYNPSVSVQKNGPLFELDGRHMIVRSLADPNPYLPLLSDMAVPVGGQRYRVTADSFLGNCKNSEDIENRIVLFKRYICPEPSAEWDLFFKDLLQHSRAITPFPATAYVLYRVAPEDKELQRILSTDPVIRKYSLRAEDYLWLILTSKLKVVQKRLKECGYLF